MVTFESWRDDWKDVEEGSEQTTDGDMPDPGVKGTQAEEWIF